MGFSSLSRLMGIRDGCGARLSSVTPGCGWWTIKSHACGAPFTSRSWFMVGTCHGSDATILRRTRFFTGTLLQFLPVPCWFTVPAVSCFSPLRTFLSRLWGQRWTVRHQLGEDRCQKSRSKADHFIFEEVRGTEIRVQPMIRVFKFEEVQFCTCEKGSYAFFTVRRRCSGTGGRSLRGLVWFGRLFWGFKWGSAFLKRGRGRSCGCGWTRGRAGRGWRGCSWMLVDSI